MSLRQLAQSHEGVIISSLFSITCSTKDICTYFVIHNLFLVVCFDVFFLLYLLHLYKNIILIIITVDWKKLYPVPPWLVTYI